MARPILSLIVTSAALGQLSSAILVGTNSPCGTSCGNVLDNTFKEDIVCTADDYGSSTGTVFKNCIHCEARSNYTTDVGKPATSDLQAMLFNLRFATSHCLFDFGINPCIISPSCEPLKAALQYENLAPNVTAYGYCSQWNAAQVPHCQACLDAMDGGQVLTNYMQVLTGACDQLIQPPNTIPLDGDIFDMSTMVNVTAPTPTGVYRPAPTVGPFSYGQLAGVVIGSVAVLLVLLGCGVVIHGKRRRKAYLKKRGQMQRNWPSPGPNGEMFETPISQKPLNGWSDSPVSAAGTEHYQQYISPISPRNGEQHFPRYFSPYTSQYNSPSSAVETSRNYGWPLEKPHDIGVAVSPDHDEVAYWGDNKGKTRVGTDQDGYELQEGTNSGGGHQYPYVQPPSHHAPVLRHPGYGRTGNTPPGSAGQF